VLGNRNGKGLRLFYYSLILFFNKFCIKLKRFATFVGINEQNNIENKLTEQNYNSISCAVSQTNIPSSDLLYTRYSSSPMTTAGNLESILV